jgi:uncharacterized caspase-like protein
MRDIRFLLQTHYGASYALIIGIDKYAKASPLSYAVSDAMDIRDLLIGDFSFPAQNVTYLVDTAASKEAILKAFFRYTRPDIGLDDRIFVFFAGHGSTLTGSRGEIGYLVPHDADPADYLSFIRWDDLTRNSELIRAKHMLFVMDACYGGLALTRLTQPGSARFLKDMMLRYSRQVLTAGKADEVVADSGGPLPGHSVFTGHLIEGLRGKAATGDSIITASGVMAYVYSKVANDKNSNQTPHYGYFDGDGDFIFRAPGIHELEEPDSKDVDKLIAIPYADEPIHAGGLASKVTRVKNLLATDSYTIELHDYLTHEVRRFLAATSEDSFAVSGQYSQDEFVSRLSRYEEAAGDLSVLLACVAHWAKAAHMATLQKCIARSSDRLESRGGLTVWLELRWYPLILELYCAGIAAVDGQRYDSLATIFYTPIPSSEYRGRDDMFVEAVGRGLLELNRTNVLKQIPGHERNYAPLSEYLFKILQPKLDDVFFLGKNYESAFDSFEVLFALVVADIRQVKDQGIWGPVGRFGWKNRQGDSSPLGRLIVEAKAMKDEWPPLKAGLFGGNYERFDKTAGEYSQMIGRLSWF